VRVRKGGITPLEGRLLLLAQYQEEDGNAEIYGLWATKISGERNSAVVRALHRLEKRGLLDSRWQDPGEALLARRPRRRFYRLTDAGRVLAEDRR
jgi:PadR family transcriptional regulator, regulatory protein PadR